MLHKFIKYNYFKKIKELNRVVVTGLGTVNPLGVNTN